MLPAVPPSSWVERAEHYQQGANKNTKIKQDGAAGHVITKFYDVAQEEGSGGTAESLWSEGKIDQKIKNDHPRPFKYIGFRVITISVHSLNGQRAFVENKKKFYELLCCTLWSLIILFPNKTNVLLN